MLVCLYLGDWYCLYFNMFVQIVHVLYCDFTLNIMYIYLFLHKLISISSALFILYVYAMICMEYY